MQNTIKPEQSNVSPVINDTTTQTKGLFDPIDEDTIAAPEENAVNKDDAFNYFVGACYGHTDKWVNGESVPEKYNAVGKFIASNKDTLAALDIENILGKEIELMKKFKEFMSDNFRYSGNKPWSNYEGFVKARDNAESANEKVKIYSYLMLELSQFAAIYTERMYTYVNSSKSIHDNQFPKTGAYKTLMNQANEEYEATQAKATQAEAISKFLTEFELASEVEKDSTVADATKQPIVEKGEKGSIGSVASANPDVSKAEEALLEAKQIGSMESAEANEEQANYVALETQQQNEAVTMINVVFNQYDWMLFYKTLQAQAQNQRLLLNQEPVVQDAETAKDNLIAHVYTLSQESLAAMLKLLQETFNHITNTAEINKQK